MIIEKSLKKVIFILFIIILCKNTVYAGEAGDSNYLPGFYGDFAMADMPGPGTYFNNFLLAYTDTERKSGTVLEMPGLIQVTDYEIFGANLLAGVFPGIIATYDHSSEQRTTRAGLADSYLMPLGLNWHWKNLKILAFEGIIAPTGRYRNDQLNSGRNIWTFDHNVALTWYLQKHNELSITAGYMNNLKNPDSKYRSGDEFHIDYTIGHHLPNGFALGIAGSYYRQIGTDRAPKNVMVPERGEASTVGPVVLFTTKMDEQEITMSLKWLHEFEAKGRERQNYLMWRIFMNF